MLFIILYYIILYYIIYYFLGKFAHTGLLTVLPAADSSELDLKPSEFTICAVLSVLQVIVYKDFYNSKYVAMLFPRCDTI